MRGIRVQAPGGLDRLEVVELADPGAPGAGEIRVRMRATSLNYHDLRVVSGEAGPVDGRIPMADGAGVVEAVGEGDSELAVGDTVVSLFFPQWIDGAPRVGDFSLTPGDGVDGYAREVVTCPARCFTKAPAGFSHAEAATLTTAGVTAWRALVTTGLLKAGETVLVLGSGGVSVFALQIAGSLGAEVIATSSSDAKLDRLRALGAAHTINYKTHPKWAHEVLDRTGGRGVDHVIEVGGAGTLAQSVSAIRIGGRISLIGAIAGRSGEVPVAAMVVKQVRLEGIVVGSRADQTDMVRGLETTALRPVIDRSYRLEELADAFRHQQAGGHLGKIVVEI